MALPIPGRVAEALRRSTVRVTSGRAKEQEGDGSGVVLTGARVVTNAHVVRGERVTVESWEGDRVPASLLKIDRGRDLALLGAPGLAAPAAILGESNRLHVGAPVVAVGNPLGFTGAVSSGVVHLIGPVHPFSGLPWIQADVRLAPGNSGGPLADYQGQVVGINTMIVAGGLALAIPSRRVQAFLSQATSGRSLGVVLRPVLLANKAVGLMILELVSGGGAESASLLPGDILIGANGSRFRSVDDLQNAMDEAPDALLRLDFYRAGQKAMRHVTVSVAPQRASSAA